ncbi:RNA-binding S4 domain-containing protein [Edaphobacillus lindanitolerans]|uniref:RQC P-site tRNA stabilizing factor n=1 Tax=Edaphobacillus lindanitolerans TaxID=550447 RepID=A0A1U7PTY8_9BACI|nr:RNA-binding S4 domain-containing protein [Edaphobacillus lindanitolerans]SIT93353.1 Ribosomal 50S subunit-recycling heat shock protein, contains S4 domain [Edaphobacillus lindanitolerans]
MRLDKFLKVSRLIKRRTLAKEVADQGRITVNGKTAKASTVVKEGDELAIRFGQKLVTARVDMLKDSVKKDEADSMFTILKEEKLEKVDPAFIDDED